MSRHGSQGRSPYRPLMIHGYRRRRSSARRIVGGILALVTLIALPAVVQTFSHSVTRLSEVRDSALSRQPAAEPVVRVPEPAISLANNAQADVVEASVVQPKAEVAAPVSAAKPPETKKAAASKPAPEAVTKRRATAAARKLAADQNPETAASTAFRERARNQRLIAPK